MQEIQEAPVNGRRTKPLCLQVGTSQTCLRVQGVFPPAGAWGSAPPNQPNFQASKLLSFQSCVQPAIAGP